MERSLTVVEVQPGSVPRERNSTNVDLAETKPWENDGRSDDTLEPKCGIVFTGMGQGLAWLSVVINK